MVVDPQSGNDSKPRVNLGFSVRHSQWCKSPKAPVVRRPIKKRPRDVEIQAMSLYVEIERRIRP